MAQVASSRIRELGRHGMDKNFYQTMPSRGRLARNLNLPPEILSETTARFRRNDAYSYVVDTVIFHRGRFYQTGSAPNFQGGMVTPCSCKHRMRTARDAGSWKGVWIAGFVSSKYVGTHKLFYLMKVSRAFESHHEFWFSHTILEKTKRAKAADLDRLGDSYRPKRESSSPYSHQSYIAPCKDHVHRSPSRWHKDINYTKGYGGRQPALLVGEPRYSFLWNEPLIPSPPFEIPRDKKRTSLGELFP